MEQQKGNPAPLGRHRARKAVHVGTLNVSENNPSLSELQAIWISRRYAVPLALAGAIAALAFLQCRRRP